MVNVVVSCEASTPHPLCRLMLTGCSVVTQSPDGGVLPPARGSGVWRIGSGMLPRESHNHPLMPIKPARLGASRLRSKAPWRGRTHAASRPPCAQERAGPAPPSVGKRAAGLWQLIGGGQSRSRDDHVPRVGRWAWAGPGVPPCSRVTPTSTSHVHLACARRRGCSGKVCLTGCSPVTTNVSHWRDQDFAVLEVL